MSSTYPEDEFDNPPEDGPTGIHRQPPSRWRPVLPFLVILVVVPLLAWGMTALLQRSGENTLTGTPQSKPTNTQSGETVAPVVPPTDPDEVEILDGLGDDSESSDPATSGGDDAVGYDYNIQVLNSSGVAGYAGDVADTLMADGFTDVTAGNTSGWVTTENTVFYSSEEQKSTAEHVAKLLNISNVTENANATGSGDIVVLLLS